MASTRNRNTPGNYCLEQRQFQNSGLFQITDVMHIVHLIVRQIM